MARYIKSRSRRSHRTAYRNQIHNYCQYLNKGQAEPGSCCDPRVVGVTQVRGGRICDGARMGPPGMTIAMARRALTTRPAGFGAPGRPDFNRHRAAGVVYVRSVPTWYEKLNLRLALPPCFPDPKHQLEFSEGGCRNLLNYQSGPGGT